MTVKWIKIVTELFEDEKIRLIESMPKGDSLLVLWFKLLCLAGKCNHSGVLLLDEQRPYDAAMLATLFRRPKKQVEQALALFAAFGMVEQASGVWFIPNWAKHQSVDAIAKKNQYMREYMKQYRAKQRQIAQVGQNIRADAAPDKPGQADGETNSKINSKANGKTNVSLPEEEKEKELELEKQPDPWALYQAAVAQKALLNKGAPRGAQKGAGLDQSSGSKMVIPAKAALAGAGAGETGGQETGQGAGVPAGIKVGRNSRRRPEFRPKGWG